MSEKIDQKEELENGKITLTIKAGIHGLNIV